MKCNCSICKKYTLYSLEWIKISCYLTYRKDRNKIRKGEINENKDRNNF